jgi:hypothetical protein
MESTTKNTQLSKQQLSFNDEVDTLTQMFKDIEGITETFSRGIYKNTSAQVYKTEDGENLVMDKNQIKTMKKEFCTKLQDLKKLHKKVKKQSKTPINPLSGKRHYMVMYAGPSIQHFVNKDPKKFGYLVPFDKSSGYLMDKLPMLKKGFLLKITISILLPIYFKANGITVNEKDSSKNEILKDKYYKEAFYGKIPAVFFFVKDKETVGKREKIFMENAVHNKLIPRMMNTYEVIEFCNSNKNPSYTLSNNNDVGMLNNYCEKNIEELEENDPNDLQIIKNIKSSLLEENKSKIIEEYTILKQVSSLYKEKKKNSQKE